MEWIGIILYGIETFTRSLDDIQVFHVGSIWDLILYSIMMSALITITFMILKLSNTAVTNKGRSALNNHKRERLKVKR